MNKLQFQWLIGTLPNTCTFDNTGCLDLGQSSGTHYLTYTKNIKRRVSTEKNCIYIKI